MPGEPVDEPVVTIVNAEGGRIAGRLVASAVPQMLRGVFRGVVECFAGVGDIVHGDEGSGGTLGREHVLDAGGLLDEPVEEAEGFPRIVERQGGTSFGKERVKVPSIVRIAADGERRDKFESALRVAILQGELRGQAFDFRPARDAGGLTGAKHDGRGFLELFLADERFGAGDVLADGDVALFTGIIGTNRHGAAARQNENEEREPNSEVVICLPHDPGLLEVPSRPS